MHYSLCNQDINFFCLILMTASEQNQVTSPWRRMFEILTIYAVDGSVERSKARKLSQLSHYEALERVRMRIGRRVEEIMIVTRMREGSTHNPLAA